MARLCGYVINQKNFYPLWPPALDTPLDLGHVRGLRLHVMPDLLILPSDLPFFVQVIVVKKNFLHFFWTESSRNSLCEPWQVNKGEKWRHLCENDNPSWRWKCRRKFSC